MIRWEGEQSIPQLPEIALVQYRCWDCREPFWIGKTLALHKPSHGFTCPNCDGPAEASGYRYTDLDFEEIVDE